VLRRVFRVLSDGAAEFADVESDAVAMDIGSVDAPHGVRAPIIMINRANGIYRRADAPDLDLVIPPRTFQSFILKWSPLHQEA